MIKLKIITSMSFILFLIGCNDSPITGEEVSKELKSYITNLGILDTNEKILLFYPPFDNKITGNYYTDKRVASYWQYSKAPKDNYIRSAFYSEIDSIGVKYGDGFERSSSLSIKKKNGESFDVYFNYEKEKIDKLHKEILKFLDK